MVVELKILVEGVGNFFLPKKKKMNIKLEISKQTKSRYFIVNIGCHKLSIQRQVCEWRVHLKWLNNWMNTAADDRHAAQRLFLLSTCPLFLNICVCACVC